MIARVTRRSFHRLLLAPVLLAFSFGVFGAAGPAHAGTLINQSFIGGVAIRGYDPVAYFTMGEAVEGSEEFAYDWLGATWHFASAEHRDLFAADPIRYVPQYGGYCSSAVAGGDISPVDPRAWRIVDSRLYLLASKGALSRWSQDTPGNIAKGDANWPVIKASLTE